MKPSTLHNIKGPLGQGGGRVEKVKATDQRGEETAGGGGSRGEGEYLPSWLEVFRRTSTLPRSPEDMVLWIFFWSL